MPNITVTNVSSAQVFLSDLYKTLNPAESITVFRSDADLSRMAGLEDLRAAGKVTVAYATAPDEGLAGGSGAVTVEYLEAPGSLVIDPAKSVSIVSNTTGGSATFTLADGTNNMIKEIFRLPGDGGDFILVQPATGAFGNVGIDLNGGGYYVKLIWLDAHGGWQEMAFTHGTAYD